jgi:tetratricopeptide (TPR) repeat protein/ferredoxin
VPVLRRPTRRDPCAAAEPRAVGVALPLLRAHPRVRRIGRWRTGVLLGVHALIAMHVAHWWTTGRTLSPLEPSEAMEFVKSSLVNAGLLFFALAILSTLLMGRWFCGWGCHVVALQDLSGWLLRRVGVRPRAVRSRVLMLVPWLAFLYMFAAPLVYRVVLGQSFALHGWHMTTDDFWATFPGWLPATLTFLTCGAAAVVFLGQKGFCTNACPYGGIFGLVDQLAPLRIRVTDDCNQCGHCSAVCTSNVRVAEEVRTYGMVVDPGCMKCLDCVNVCPNGALFVGLGAPAAWAAPRARQEHVRHGLPRDPPRAPAADTAARRPDRAGALLGWTFTGAFSFLALLVFMGYDHSFAWRWSDVLVCVVLSAGTLGVLGLVRVRSVRGAELPWHEEGLLAVLFLAAMLVFRGLYGLVAFLFALGLAAVLAWLGLCAWRGLRLEDAHVQRWALKRAGRYQPAGYLMLAGMGLLGLAAHSAVLQHHVHALGRGVARLAAQREPGAPLDAAGRAVLEQALEHAAFVERWSLLPARDSSLRHARLYRLAGRPDEYERRMNILLARGTGDGEALLELADFHAAAGRAAAAEALYRRYIERWPLRPRGYAALSLLFAAQGDLDESRRVVREGLARAGEGALLYLHAGLLEASGGDLAGALPLLKQAVALDPHLPAARFALGRALLEQGDNAAACTQLEAARSGADDAELRLLLGLAYARRGMMLAALPHLERASELAPESPQAHQSLADVLLVLGRTEEAERAAQRAAALSTPSQERLPER